MTSRLNGLKNKNPRPRRDESYPRCHPNCPPKANRLSDDNGIRPKMPTGILCVQHFDSGTDSQRASSGSHQPPPL